MGKAVLLVEHEEPTRRFLSQQLADDGFEVFARSLSIGAETMVMRFEPERPLHDRARFPRGAVCSSMKYEAGHPTRQCPSCAGDSPSPRGSIPTPPPTPRRPPGSADPSGAVSGPANRTGIAAMPNEQRTDTAPIPLRKP